MKARYHNFAGRLVNLAARHGEGASIRLNGAEFTAPFDRRALARELAQQGPGPVWAWIHKGGKMVEGARGSLVLRAS